ncbi:nickel/cobalt transporter [Kiloniella antarctica]|uniref:Nickel/cobalt efflux system n=1 Tax=Kiloniella antarctica TaxID=1550907 RepID=A0ABW5BMD8_9PROT
MKRPLTKRFWIFFFGLTLLFLGTFFAGRELDLFQSENTSLWAGFFAEIREQQRSFSTLLSDGVRALGDDISFDSILYLIWICFLYGVFHAIGPGHGKAVIAAYTLTTDTRVLPSIVLAMASSFMQGLTAILIVGIAYFVIESGVRSASLAAENVMEPLSYGAVLIVGLVLLWRGVRYPVHAECNHDGHNQDDQQSPPKCCSHGHLPSPEQVSKIKRWRDLIGIVLAVGIRPCTGALLVLILAFVLGHWAGGLAAVIAMSFGTGITVSLLAVVARGARYPLLKALDEVGVHAGVVGRVVSVAGGGLIVLVGGILLFESITTPTHPFG